MKTWMRHEGKIKLPGFFGFRRKYSYQVEYFPARERTVFYGANLQRISHPEIILVWFERRARKKLGMKYHAYVFAIEDFELKILDSPNTFREEVCLGDFPDKKIRESGLGNVFWNSYFSVSAMHCPVYDQTVIWRAFSGAYLRPEVYFCIKKLEEKTETFLFEGGSYDRHDIKTRWLYE